jgi:hypothetical protein
MSEAKNKTTQVTAKRAGPSSQELALAPAEANLLYEGYATLDPTWQQTQAAVDAKNRLSVGYSVSSGATPALCINWIVEDGWYRKGYRVDFFLSVEGFPALTNNTPLDQLNYGRCIYSANSDDMFTTPLGEGSSYLTALLVSKKPTGIVGRYIGEKRKQWLGSYVSVPAMVQFTVNVPSLKVGLSRIIDQNRLTKEVRDNVTARVELAAIAGELDLDWHSTRYGNDVSRQIKERLIAWEKIDSIYREQRKRVEENEQLSASDKHRLLNELELLRKSDLGLRQYPVRDAK